MGYVFISYSTQQQEIADDVRQLLMDEQIECWMAPYDIPAGSRYAAVIEKAIKNCACFLLLFTEAAQSSVFVGKEVERAISHRKTVIPMKLDDTEMNEEFLFFLSNQQSIRVTEIDKNSAGIKKILRALRNHTGAAAPAPSQTQQSAPKPAPSQTQQSAPKPAPSQSQQPAPKPAPAAVSAEDGLERGRTLVENECYEEAVSYLSGSAEGGSAEAQYLMGMCYKCGKSIKNLKTAVKWFNKSAKQLYEPAQYELGCCYYYGWGVSVDYKEALIWFRMAEKEHAGCKFMMGKCYFTGNGYEQDYDEALRRFRQAASDDFPEAQNALGECYLEGYGTEVDLSKAWRWFNEAADQGCAMAMYHMGTMYEDGKWVDKDLKKAIEMYQKAEAKGCEEARQALVRLDFFQQPVAPKPATQRATQTAQTSQTSRKPADLPDFQVENDVLVKFNGTGASVQIPDGIKAIADEAFAGNTVITDVFVPASVANIGAHAFFGCTKLASVRIAKRSDLTEIGEGAFAQSVISEITIPRTVKKIGLAAFQNCKQLSSVNFQNGEDWLCWQPISAHRRKENNFRESELEAANAATLLTKTYCEYTWEKK